MESGTFHSPRLDLSVGGVQRSIVVRKSIGFGLRMGGGGRNLGDRMEGRAGGSGGGWLLAAPASSPFFTRCPCRHTRLGPLPVGANPVSPVSGDGHLRCPRLGAWPIEWLGFRFLLF
eukprot:358593-Chlamydomonas_euryale.AAC.5